MKRFQPAVSRLVALALALSAPGSAAAQAVAARARAAVAGPAFGAATAPIAAPMPSELVAAAAVGAPIAIAPRPAAAHAALSAVEAKAEPSGAETAGRTAEAPARTALEGLRLALPEPSGLSKASAADDFLARVGEAAWAEGETVLAAGSGVRTRLAEPRARREGGSSPSVPPRAGRHGRELAALFGIGALSGGILSAAVFSAGSLALVPMVIASLILHEIGHARMADALGDPTARLRGRASLDPRRWLTHVDPVMTLLVPAATFLALGFVFGSALPVEMARGYRFFKDPGRDMAIVGLAGPVVNLGLAAAGAAALGAAAALGVGAGAAAALAPFVFVNALLAVSNLIPLPPFDGGHVLGAFLPAPARARVDAFLERIGLTGGLLLAGVVFLLLGGVVTGAALAVARALIEAMGGSAAGLPGGAP